MDTLVQEELLHLDLPVGKGRFIGDFDALSLIPQMFPNATWVYPVAWNNGTIMAEVVSLNYKQRTIKICIRASQIPDDQPEPSVKQSLHSRVIY